MTIIARSHLTRSILLALETAGLLAAFIWVSTTYLAGLSAEKMTVKDLQIAVKLSPWNSDYRLRLGRLFQYNVMDIDLPQATKHFTKAGDLSPHDPRPWLELGSAVELQGRTSDAETYLLLADSLAPNIPLYQWAIGNFMLLHGNVEEAFRHFKVVLAGSSRYNAAIFSTAWKASGDADKILDILVPPNSPAELSYLNYLISEKRYDEAGSVWARMIKTWKSLLPRQAGGYLDALIESGRAEEAQGAWKDLIRRGFIRGTYQTTDENLLVNSNFEEEPLNMGFDWRLNRAGGVYAGLDGTIFHSPGHSLLIQFSGKANVYYRHSFQYVPVQPGHTYLLQGYVRTEGITTDSGPRFEVRDANDSHLLRELSEDLRGSTLGWQTVGLQFTPGPRTKLIAVGVTRLPSRKLDNLIAGRVWLDDLSLRAVTGPPASTR